MIWKSLRVLILALFSLSLNFAWAHAQEAPPQSPKVIRIGVAAEGVGGRPYSYRMSLDVARAQGLVEKAFAASGTKIEWHYFRAAGPAVSEAIASHQVDFVFHGDLPSIIVRSTGIKTRYLMPLYARSNTYVAVPAKSNIRTLADLRGKVVSNFRGTATQLVAARVLSSVGLSERDLKLVNLDTAGVNAALATGQVDAGFVLLNSLGLKDQGLIRYIFATNFQPRFSAVGGLLVTDEFARQYPQSVDRFVQAIVQGAWFAGQPQNREAVYAIWAKSGLPQNYFEREYKDQDLRVTTSPLVDDFVVAKYKTAAADALRFGLVRKPVDLNGWFDKGPLNRALSALHLEHFWTPYSADGKPAA